MRPSAAFALIASAAWLAAAGACRAPERASPAAAPSVAASSDTATSAVTSPATAIPITASPAASTSSLALAEAVYEDWYPADIKPPEGTQYPCALTALPRELPGIPTQDRRFINHAYTLILKATQAKLLALHALEQGRDSGSALAAYQEETGRLAERLHTEPVPAGLEPFRDDVLTALDLQRAFFERGEKLRRDGRAMAEVYAVPEGREASRRLVTAWGRMQARYPGWSAAMRDSVYHHLCALDLF